MKLALGIFFLASGAAGLYVASHGMEAATPWAAWKTLLGKMGGAEYV